MHVGEDVDLTWRLRDQGWTISYLPAGNVLHEHRSSIRSFMSRRFDYGTSEGMLQLLHPRRHKQMVIPSCWPGADALPCGSFCRMVAAGRRLVCWWPMLLSSGLRFIAAASRSACRPCLAGTSAGTRQSGLLPELPPGPLLCDPADLHRAAAFRGSGSCFCRLSRCCALPGSIMPIRKPPLSFAPLLRHLPAGTDRLRRRRLLGLPRGRMFCQLPGDPAPAHGAVCIGRVLLSDSGSHGGLALQIRSNNLLRALLPTGILPR